MFNSLDPMDCSPPGSSVHGILRAMILEWVAIPFSKGSSQTQELNPGLLHCRQILYHPRHQGNPSELNENENWCLILGHCIPVCWEKVAELCPFWVSYIKILWGYQLFVLRKELGMTAELSVSIIVSENIYISLLKEFFFLFYFDVNNLKYVVNFFTILLQFYVLVFWLWGMREFTFLTKDRTCTSCIVRASLNHWTTREFPTLAF